MCARCNPNLRGATRSDALAQPGARPALAGARDLLERQPRPYPGGGAVDLARPLRPPARPRGPGGRPPLYRADTVRLLALVQTVWRLSYSEVVDYLASHDALADTIGCPPRQADGTRRTISQGQYWQRRAALGVLPLVFFFLALVCLLLRAGLISGRDVVVDSTRLRAWWRHDPGASWSRCRGKATIWGYAVVDVLQDGTATSLSERQLAIIRLVAEGLTTRDIGNALGISEHRVKQHISAILEQLGANDRAHAVAIALRQGLL